MQRNKKVWPEANTKKYYTHTHTHIYREREKQEHQNSTLEKEDSNEKTDKQRGQKIYRK